LKIKMLIKLKKPSTELFHFVDGVKIDGVHSKITGDVSRLTGDVTGVCGDIDACKLTGADRKEGINISNLIEN